MRNTANSYDWGGFLQTNPSDAAPFSPSTFGRLLLAVDDETGALDLIGAEADLGNPASNGRVLSSTTAGVRSWVDFTQASLPTLAGYSSTFLTNNGSRASWGSLSSLTGGGYAYRDLKTMATKAIDDALAGKSTSDEPIFSTRNNAGSGTYVRSSTSWVAGIDLTSAAVYSATGKLVGVAVTPRQIISSHHAHPAVSAEVRFQPATGAVVSRTIASTQQYASTDIEIQTLSSDLPASITPAKVLTAAQEAALIGGAILFIDQDQSAFTGDVYSVTGGLYASQSDDSTRAGFWKLGVDNDSSHPAYAILDGEAVFIGCFESAYLTYDNFASVAQNFSGINTALAALTGSHQLTQFKSSVLPEFQPLSATLTAWDAISTTGKMYYLSAADTFTPVTIGPNLTFTSGTLDTAASVGVVDGQILYDAQTPTHHMSLDAGNRQANKSTDDLVLDWENLYLYGAWRLNGAMMSDDFDFDALSGSSRRGIADDGSTVSFDWHDATKFETRLPLYYSGATASAIAKWDGSKLLKSATASDIRTAAGATTIGTSVLTLANPSAVTFPRYNADNTVTARTAAQLKTDLSLTIGTDVQAYDADLTTWSGITPGTGVATFLGTPSSANLAAALTDETGSGAAVFGTSPTLVTPIISTVASAAGADFNANATAAAQTTSAQAGQAAKLTASNAVAGSSVAGAAAGGSITVTAGNAARLTSGNANGGDINLVPGNGIGTGVTGKTNVSSTVTQDAATGAYGQLELIDIATPAMRLSLGYNNSSGNGWGFIQALKNSAAYTPLRLQPSGSYIQVGTTSTSAGTGDVILGGKLNVVATNTASGTTGAQTINKGAGTVNLAASATSLVVTNSLVTANSLVLLTVRTNDASAFSLRAVPTSGSFTIYVVGTAPAAETSVGFMVVNQ